MASEAWKSLEKVVAEKLGGHRRMARSGNRGISDFDVEIPDFLHWKIDAKYRKAQPFRHHGMLKKIAKKYCKKKHEVPVLVTKNGHEHGECVTMRLDDFASILNALRGARLAIADEVFPELRPPVSPE